MIYHDIVIITQINGAVGKMYESSYMAGLQKQLPL